MIRLAVVLLLLSSSLFADDLTGLWTAKKRFGPDARGALVIEKQGQTYSADMIGRRWPVNVERGELSFALPRDGGSFRGKVAGDAIRGHWFPPPSSALFTGGRFASPVRLLADGANRWRGEVVPFDDTFTFHLLIRKRDDGTLGAFLHNPDRGYAAGVDRIEVTGNAVKLLGKREWASGSYDAEREVLTLHFPGRGGAYEFRRDGDDSDFYPRGKQPGKYVYHPPLARDDGWPVGTVGEADIDRAGIEKFIQLILETPMESIKSPQVHAILIARRGKLVVEEYFHGEHRDKLHDTRSAAKSLTATIVGAAMHAGAPLTLATPVYQVMNGGTFPEGLEPRKRAMTLEHLLTMSSGYFCDDTNPEAPGGEEAMLDQQEERDYYRFTLKVPMAFDPGKHAIYCSANPNLALGMVSRATGESPMATFDRLLGEPMKIRRYGWILDPAGNPYGGGSVNLLPRDFLKIGQLMLNGGTWEGRRILSREFVKRASAPLYHLRNVQYGYQWWHIEYPYKDRTLRAFYAGGAGGQGVIVVPELDLVIGTFAANYADRVGLHIQQEYAPRYILPAVREKGDDPKAPVIWTEFKSKYGRSEINGPVIP